MKDNMMHPPLEKKAESISAFAPLAGMDVTSNFQANAHSLSRLEQGTNLKNLGFFGGRVGDTRECLGCRGRGVARGWLFDRSLRLNFVETVTFNDVLHTHIHEKIMH